ncbi:hypothetical protein MJD09_11735 [bacterium]|nr:hypothetical protein [bacterium]
MKRLSITILIFLLCASRWDVVHAGAWTQQKGHYYSKFSLHRFESTSQFLLNGDRQPLADNGRVVDVSFFYYLEYGLFDDLTFVLSVPVKTINFSCAIEGCDNSSSGLGDTVLGLRYRLSQTDWIVSVQTGVKLAPGYETDEDALESRPPLGDGQTDFEMRLLIGRSVLNYRAYLNFDVGYRARSGEPINEVIYGLEFGYNLSRHYLLAGQLSGIRGISENQNQQDFTILNGMIQNFVGTGALEDFMKAQVQLTYKLNPTLELSFLFERVLLGRNTSAATVIGGGFAINR